MPMEYSPIEESSSDFINDLRLESNKIRKVSSRNGRSSSLFSNNQSTFALPSGELRWRNSSNNNGRKLVRRFSSPVLSTESSSRLDANGEKVMNISDIQGDRADAFVDYETNRLDHDREFVSRSVSLRFDDDSGMYASFCPSDLEFKEFIGRGFFGEVYKVIHKETGRPMVLKRIYRVDSKCESDFLKEAAVMRQLHHPNVLQFLGILYNDKKLHLITEYISGGTLRKLLDSTIEFTWPKRVSIARDVAAGMAYLHSKNIIHRDLNSGNILLRQEDSSAVVADFGLARILGRRRTARRRRLTVVGTPYLMAPEMAKEENYNDSVDVFSYGITLCEIIGRCSSDPDIMPRREDFGVDQDRFRAKFVADSCPVPFLDIAFKCAAVNSDERPPFSLVHQWLVALLADLVCDTNSIGSRIAMKGPFLIQKSRRDSSPPED